MDAFDELQSCPGASYSPSQSRDPSAILGDVHAHCVAHPHEPHMRPEGWTLDDGPESEGCHTL